MWWTPFGHCIQNDDDDLLSQRALVFVSVLYGYIQMHKRSDRVFADRTVDLAASDQAIVAAAVGDPLTG